jgi:hypothetical protein
MLVCDYRYPATRGVCMARSLRRASRRWLGASLDSSRCRLVPPDCDRPTDYSRCAAQCATRHSWRESKHQALFQPMRRIAANVRELALGGMGRSSYHLRVRTRGGQQKKCARSTQRPNARVTSRAASSDDYFPFGGVAADPSTIARATSPRACTPNLASTLSV